MLTPVYKMCLQGNVHEAYQYLQHLEQTPPVKRLSQKYFNRFFREKPILRVKTKDPWIKQVIYAYYFYFIDVLARRISTEDAENILLERLLLLIPEINTDEVNLDRVELELEKQFHNRGYQFLGGVTAPYRGPYIWKRTDKHVYRVQIPNGEQEVTVFFMHDFILHSWLHFATFGKYATGGWAKEDGLYCGYDRYKNDLDKPSFQVSFLKHEAQHLDDYKRFPGLASKDLEYRAKLVELIYNPSLELYHKFAQSAKEDPTLPHAYAQYAIMKEMSKEPPLDPKKIQEIAERLYVQHTDQLLKLGSDYSEGLI